MGLGHLATEAERIFTSAMAAVHAGAGGGRAGALDVPGLEVELSRAQLALELVRSRVQANVGPASAGAREPGPRPALVEAEGAAAVARRHQAAVTSAIDQFVAHL
ncbi:MAG TPA: hypothetical protein VHK88_11735, partial [Aquihabitans sp.]|nr:hypothetical protein [Aquihabitans sp.]